MYVYTYIYTHKHNFNHIYFVESDSVLELWLVAIMPLLSCCVAIFLILIKILKTKQPIFWPAPL